MSYYVAFNVLHQYVQRGVSSLRDALYRLQLSESLSSLSLLSPLQFISA